MREFLSIRTSININLQNCLVKLSTILNPSHNLRPSYCRECFVLLCLVHLRLLCMHTALQDQKLPSHIHLRTSLNACKITTMERRVLRLEMLQLSDIWLSCVCSFDLFISLLMSGHLSGEHNMKSFSYFHYMSVYIYIVCTLTISREITRFVSGIPKKTQTWGMQNKERSKHKLLIFPSFYLSPCQQFSICLE